jgi:manganese transport protein
MKAIFQIALGIIAAIGGFVDIGDLVFNIQAGALFGYQLLWAVAIGVIGIATYAEMCGRVAAVTGRPVFEVVRERLGFTPGLLTLVGSEIVNLMTVGAELGGIALILQYFFDADYTLLVMVAIALLVTVTWVLPFEGIERVFGYGGLLLLVFAAVALHRHPDWSGVADGLVPHAKESSLYAYFAVGLVSAALMPYEVYFYSSGAVEERWTTKDLSINRLNALIGYGIGALLSAALIMTATQVLMPQGVQPEFLGTVALSAQVPFGETGLLLALGGMLMAIGGAAIDACFSGAYNLAQFAGWEWGKYRRPTGAPRFTLAWLGFFVLGGVVVLSGIDPVQLTEYSVVFSVVVLPLTYLPILLIARDRNFMGEHANGPITGVLGWFYLVLIAVVALAAIPLLFATNAGGG